MRAMSLRTFPIVCLIAATGCGVSLQDYDERTTELKRAEGRLARSMLAEKQAQAAIAEEAKQLEAANTQLKEIEKVMGELGLKSVADRDGAKRAVAEVQRARAVAAQQALEIDQLTRGLRDELELGGVRIENRGGMLRLVLPAQGLFASGTMLLDPMAKKTLDGVARALGRLPQRRLLVSGHSDDKIHGNFALTVGRARMVTEFLMRSGVEAGRISVAGMAEFEPIAENTTDEGRARNRRVEIALVPSPDFVPPPIEARPAPLPPPPAPPPIAAPVKAKAGKAGKAGKTKVPPEAAKPAQPLTDDPGI
ncbi:MAG: OmpA family protein [Myxococcales bacterium]|nr:OmpA family protein [Myxococcales bacterium]